MTKIKTIKYYFDCISPYAWLGWRPINALAEKHKLRLEPVPVLFSKLLEDSGTLGPAEIPKKRIWIIKDVARRAHFQGMKVNIPPKHPFNPLLALRAISCIDDNDEKKVMTGALLDAAWLHGLDISDHSVVDAVADSVGLKGKLLASYARTDTSVKDLLKHQTEDAIQAGVFGVPSVQVEKEIFWGSEKETMDQIESAILGEDSLDKTLVDKWIKIPSGATRRR